MQHRAPCEPIVGMLPKLACIRKLKQKVCKIWSFLHWQRLFRDMCVGSQHSRGQEPYLLWCSPSVPQSPKSVNNVYLESQLICSHHSRPRSLHTNQLEKYCFSGPISIFIDLRRPEGRCLLRKSVPAKVSLYWLQLFGSPLSGQR